MYCPCGEPRLADLLGDPILHLLLARDRVSLDELQTLIERARHRRRRAEELPLN